MSILVFNAGSTSLKFGLFDDEAQKRTIGGEVDWADGNRQQARMILRLEEGQEKRSQVAVPDDPSATRRALEALSAHGGTLETVKAVGHRVVHGGAEFQASTRVDARVKEAIRQLFELAPLHNPPALRAMEMAETLLPGIPQVAVFDTTFYAHLPQKAYFYPLPYEWQARFGVRRFGFHGTSHAYCLARATEMLGTMPARIISCHLGGGCSATAIQNGQAMATTLGFSPLEGLMMGTRCGSVDPGLLIHLQRQHGLSLDELDHALNYQSGLSGISGIAPDLARIETAMKQGNERARLAFDMFADRVRSAIGSLAVTMGGCDALIFTDRIGEGSPAMRAAIAEGLQCLGIQLNPKENERCQPDADITGNLSRSRVLVIKTQEELMIAREARRVASAPGQ